MTGPPGPCGCGCALTPATSLGFSAAEFAEDVLRIGLIPWQRWLLIHALETLRDGRFRFRTVLVLVARQNGKTTVVEIKNLFKMFVLRVPLVIGTAQNLDVSEESWDKAVEIVESIPELAAEVPKEGGIVRVNGKKSLKLAHGSRWKVAAASRKGGRGLSGDDVNLDELREHHTWDSWAAVTKTTMARRKAQIWAFSNAGDDRSVVLNALQEKGQAAAADPSADATMGIFEWSAPDDCPIDDPQMWRLANPSLGYPQGISHEALRAALETDPEPIFRTECLCQRVPDLVPSKIPLTNWVRCADPRSQISGGVVLTWEVGWHRDRAAIAVAGLRADGLPHVELVEYRDGDPGWLPGRLGQIAHRQPVLEVVYDPAGPAGSLLTEVTERLPVGLDPRPLTTREMAHACARIYDAAMAGTLRHLGDDRLLEMLRRSATRSLADAWAWDRKHSGSDISGLVGVTVALQGLSTHDAPPPPPESPPPMVSTGAYAETHPLARAGF